MATAKTTPKSLTAAEKRIDARIQETVKEVIKGEFDHYLKDLSFRIGQAYDLLDRAGNPAPSQTGKVYAEDLNVMNRAYMTGYTLTNNSPVAGSVAWADLHMVYNGTDTLITNGNSANKYVWWSPVTTPNVLQSNNVKPTLAPGEVLLFVNTGGTHKVMLSDTNSSMPSILADGTVDSGSIIANAVGTTAIAANAVTSAELNTGAVTTGKIAGGAVTATEIGPLAVTTAKIAAGAVTATEIGPLAVTSAKVAVGAINNTNMIAANTITGTNLNAGAVTTGKIAANVVTSTELNAGAVTTAKIAGGAVTANELGALSVTTAKIAANAVTATELNAGAVTTAKIAASAVTTNEIGAGAITTVKVAAGAVDATKLTIMRHMLY